MAVSLILSNPVSCVQLLLNLPRACNDVLIADGKVQGAQAYQLGIYKVNKEGETCVDPMTLFYKFKVGEYK